MSQPLFVICDKQTGRICTMGRNQNAYLTEGRAKAAMRNRGMSTEDYEIVEYKAKEESK